MGRIVEGFWDCQYCDTKGIPGSISKCPHCSKERDYSTKFYLKKDDMRYLSEEEKKNVPNGPDWLCSYCDSYNHSDVKVCSVCGHERDSDDEDYFEVRKNEDEKANKHNPQSQNQKVNQPTTSDNTNIIPDKKRKSNLFKYFGIGAGMLTFIALILFFFIPKETTFEVTDIYWEYGVAIEEYRTVEESDWYLPSGARLYYSQEEIYEYQTVIDHYETRTREVSEQVLDGYDTVVTGYEDLGNGYFEEITSQVPRYRTEYRTETYEEPVYVQVPVYKTKYYYEIDKWIYDRTLKTEGNTKDTYFEDYTLDINERFSTKSKKYVFYGIVDNENKDMQVNESIWNQYDVGDIIPIKINRAGIITIIEEQVRRDGFGGK